MENPFGSNNISEDKNRIISGKVDVQNDTDNSGVFVWLEELNISTWTDSDGNFKLKIPAKSESVPGGGLTEYVNIYYFIANFRLEKSQVYIFDSAFKYGEADLNEKGEIKDTIILKKKLDIFMSVEPFSINVLSSDTIKFSVRLTATGNDAVLIGTEKDRADQWTGIFIKSISDPGMEPYRILDGLSREDLVAGQRNFGLQKPFQALYLSPGVYEIIPYIIFVENLPAGLLDAIDKGVRSYNEKYFKYPIRVTTATLEVTE